MPFDLSDARAKLARSRYHVDQIDRMIAGYLSSRFYEVVFNPNECTLVLKSLHPPDRQINATLGDAVGNLRSVLDYIINSVLQPITGKSNATFPFADDLAGWKGEVNKSMSATSESVKHVLMDKVQGYKGGKGEVLWQLNTLRNIDKHRLLLITANTAGVRMWGTINGTMRLDGCVMGGPAGNNQNLIGGITSAVFDRQPEPVFEVRICELKYMKGIEVMEFLRRAANAVEGVLQAFAEL